MTLASGLKIAFLSGMFDRQMFIGNKKQEKQMKQFYTKQHFEQLLKQSEKMGPIDILIAHEWPLNICKHSKKSIQPLPGGTRKMSDAICQIKARYCFGSQEQVNIKMKEIMIKK